MVKDAEQFAQQDAEARVAAEERNLADTLAYQTEKTLRESGDRISDTDKQSVESALSDLRDALKSNDNDRIRSARENLERVWAPVASNLYQQAGSTSGPEEPGDGHTGSQGQPSEDDVVDAEFRSSEES